MKIVNFNVGKKDANVVGYLHEENESAFGHYIRPSILVCPGGSYRYCSPREAEPVAFAYFNVGFQVFILTYTCAEDIKNSDPLLELAQTMQIIKERSVEWKIDKEKIGVVGFSAGGHLVASLATLYGEEFLSSYDCKPSLVVLCYPVISTEREITHELSAKNLSYGWDERRKYLSLEKRVNKDTVPTFIWHTRHDGVVNVANTLAFINALWENGVDFEAHIFEDGGHGLSMCTQEVNTVEENTKVWFELSLKYICTKWEWKI